MRVAELFAGYGATRMGLDMIKQRHEEFCYEVVAISEIDKYALKAYELAHGDCPNYGDVRNIDWETFPDVDLVTWSWPCTSISQSGRREGMEEGSGTASSLAFDALKCFKVKRPKHLLAENVPAIYQQKNKKSFDEILRRLEDMGYSNFHGVLDASLFGVAQARKRFFMLSILKDEEDPQPRFSMPIGEEPNLCIEDIMEDEADEKYYLDQKKVDEKLALIPRDKLESFLDFD